MIISFPPACGGGGKERISTILWRDPTRGGKILSTNLTHNPFQEEKST
ncbi:MAG: hypothetical protein LBR79_02230 [Oscillospiraceae bacterium]|nr:hypothetical protein [Oscillospiraceae bacterium]